MSAGSLITGSPTRRPRRFGSGRNDRDDLGGGGGLRLRRAGAGDRRARGRRSDPPGRACTYPAIDAEPERRVHLDRGDRRQDRRSDEGRHDPRGHVFHFGANGILRPGQILRLHSGTGHNTALTKYWNYTDPLLANSGTVRLRTSGNQPITRTRGERPRVDLRSARAQSELVQVG